jgi:tRNA pseudouridine13 synthase
VRRLLQILLPREHLFPVQYQAGTLLFHRDAAPEVVEKLREATFPLLSSRSEVGDPDVKKAVEWVLGKEKLKLSDLHIDESPKLLYFKHEERPVLVYPHKLVIGSPAPDELNRGFKRVNVAFTLPPGAYATLVIKRLFHQSYREDSAEDIRASQRARAERAEEAVQVPQAPPSPAPRAPRPPRIIPAPEPQGFRARQLARKSARKEAQAITAKQLESRKKRR